LFLVGGQRGGLVVILSAIAGSGGVVMVVLIGFLLSSVVYRGSLLDAGIMALPFELRLGREAQNPLHGLS